MEDVERLELMASEDEGPDVIQPTEAENRPLKQCLGGANWHELICYRAEFCPVCFWRELWVKCMEGKW